MPARTARRTVATLENEVADRDARIAGLEAQLAQQVQVMVPGAAAVAEPPTLPVLTQATPLESAQAARIAQLEAQIAPNPVAAPTGIAANLVAAPTGIAAAPDFMQMMRSHMQAQAAQMQSHMQAQTALIARIVEGVPQPAPQVAAPTQGSVLADLDALRVQMLAPGASAGMIGVSLDPLRPKLAAIAVGPLASTVSELDALRSQLGS